MHVTDALVHVPPFAIAYKNQLKLVIFSEEIRMYMCMQKCIDRVLYE